ncbi:MAG TPA: P63C domain-containing protein [Phycisphaerae bacterium]|jgi:hypothetical protein
MAGKLGGEARAKSLNAEKRADIARVAAEARWGAGVPMATHTGIMQVGDMQLECAVLSDGERVLSQRGFMRALAIKHGGQLSSQRTDEGGGAIYPLFVAQKSLRPFIDKELLAVLSNPIKYRTSGGVAFGVRADLIPKVCDVWLKARDAGVLSKAQMMIAVKADIIVRGLAQVGIVALVDEATGYQDVRARDALAKILEAFVAKELRKWVKTFPPEYFKEMCRLKGKPFAADMKLPRYFAVHTNDVVYSRLAPGVLVELRAKNPTTESGRRKHKNFQWLTEDIGNPKLLQHLAAVVALMRASLDWDGFKTLIDRALPKYQSLPLLDGNEYDTD